MENKLISNQQVDSTLDIRTWNYVSVLERSVMYWSVKQPLLVADIFRDFIFYLEERQEKSLRKSFNATKRL